MKAFTMLFAALMTVLLVAPVALAGDFEWLRDLDIRAEADPAGFRAQLAARFKIGPAEISAVISTVERPADAYLVLRLGEMSQRPTDQVIEQYRSGKGQGWGVLAKSLGIKPGSREFHALKRGHDLNNGNDHGTGKGKSKGKGKGKEKGKGDNQEHAKRRDGDERALSSRIRSGAKQLPA